MLKQQGASRIRLEIPETLQPALPLWFSVVRNEELPRAVVPEHHGNGIDAVRPECRQRCDRPLPEERLYSGLSKR